MATPFTTASPDALTNAATIHWFMQSLFGTKPADAYLLIWTKAVSGAKESSWTPDLATATTMIGEASAGADVYIGCGTRDHDFGPYERGKSGDVTGIPGFWADFDTADPSHKETNLPPDTATAVAFLNEFPLRPTIVIHSGHGLQLWWTFPTFWSFASADEREHAARLSQGLQKQIKTQAAAHGWNVDMTYDLARVLRVPGTFNRKREPVVPVHVLVGNGPRHNPSAFVPFIDATTSDTSSTGTDPLVLSAGAMPPAAKFEALAHSHPTFRASFERTRTDLADRSPSAFDMAIASICAGASWSDQEIADTIIASREAAALGNGRIVDDKIYRQDYMARTIAKARATATPASGATTDSVVTEIAAVIGEQHHFARDPGGMLYVYQGGVYVPQGEKRIKRLVKQHLRREQRSKEWTSHRAKEVIEYIAVDAPELWERPPLDTVNVQNGLLDLEAGELQPHSPDHRSPIQIPVTYDPAARCPAWEKFVKQVFPADARKIAWETPGYLMVADTALQKALLLLGDGANGKSTYLAAVLAFIGERNVTTVPLQKLEQDRFAASRLVGKLANICADLPSTDLTSTSMFKALTGGDRITAEYKFKESFEFVPYARLIFSANTPPQSADAGEAFYRRWDVIPFDQVFTGRGEIPRPVLDARLADPREQSGVLNKALPALGRIHRQKGFTVAPSMQEAARAFREATDPLAAWLEQYTQIDPEGFLPKESLVMAYNAHCEQLGRPHVTSNAFSRALKKLRPQIGEGQRTMPGTGVVKHVWLGINLRPIMGGGFR